MELAFSSDNLSYEGSPYATTHTKITKISTYPANLEYANDI